MDDLIIEKEHEEIFVGGSIADDGEIEVCGLYKEQSMYIGAEEAEQIVNHLIKVFDITPEQRNK